MNSDTTAYAGRHRRHGGTAILEMSLVMPMLIFLALGMVEFGQFFYVKNAFQQAARDALRAAIMPNAQQPDPATAATRALAAVGITMQPSWLSVVDITPGGFGGAFGAATVTDCSTITPGHGVTVTVQTTYATLPVAVRPLYAIVGTNGWFGVKAGISPTRIVSGSVTGLKE